MPLYERFSHVLTEPHIQLAAPLLAVYLHGFVLMGNK